MRTIVAFLFGAALAAQAQQRPDPEEQIKRQENRVAQNPDRVAERVTLLRLYFGNGHSLPPEKVREERRRHITWLIEHHPDANEFAQPEFVIEAKGSPLADPEGFAEAARLWREQAAKPDASAKTI